MSKKQKLFHCTVTFTGVGSATIRDVTQEQAWAIQDVMRLIERQPPRYSNNGDLLYFVTTETVTPAAAITVRGGFLARLMRRFNAWAMGGCVILALMLGAECLAQDFGPRAVQPIRIALTLEETTQAEEFNVSLRAELSNLRQVAFVSSAVNFDIYATGGPIVAGQKTIGYASAVAVVTPGKGDRPIRVLLVLGPNSKETARLTARRINEEFFQKASR